MNAYLSLKIKIFSFVLMIMVVFLHSYNLLIKFKSLTITVEKGPSSFIQEFISGGITHVAVPLFFIISSYLFFLKLKGDLFKEYLSKLRKSISTILMPFIIWSAWGILFFFILQEIPQTKIFFTNNLIRDYTINQFFNVLFINPIAYQLWFLRDLFILIILSPLIFVCIQKIGWFFMIPIGLLWFLNINLVSIQNQSLFFFVSGALMAMKISDLMQERNQLNAIAYSGIWILIITLKTTVLYLDYGNELVVNLLEKIGILIGCVALWKLYDRLAKHKCLENMEKYSFLGYSFFLYLIHEPILSMFKKIFFFILGQNQSLLVYFLAPVITIFLGLAIGLALKRSMPKLYFILTGGR